MSLTQQKADELLQRLGMNHPAAINVDQVAQSLDARVIYHALAGCCARLIGYKDRAVIMVDSGATEERQRFSIAHELGHWIFDRGHQVRNDNMTRQEIRALEKRADQFASDLVLPDFQVRPRVQDIDVEFASIEDLRQLFRTSLTATAIKLVQCTPVPCVVCCYSLQGNLKWHVVSSGFPLQVRPHSHLRSSTAAARSAEGRVPAQPVPLSAWFPDAPVHYEIREESLLSSRFSMILSVLRWPLGQPLSAPSA